MTSFAKGLLKDREITTCSPKISDLVAISLFLKEKVKVWIFKVIVGVWVTRNNRLRKPLFKIILWKKVNKQSLDQILLGQVNKRKDFKKSRLSLKIDQGSIRVNKWLISKLNMLIRKDLQNWCRVMYHNLRNVSQLQESLLKIISLHRPLRTLMTLKRPPLQDSTFRVLRALILIDNRVNRLHQQQLMTRVWAHLWNSNPRFINSFNPQKISKSVINNNWMAAGTHHLTKI